MPDKLSWDDVPAFMEQLRWTARDLLRRERHAGLVQTTELVQTVLRRQKQKEQEWEVITWENQDHFFKLARRIMRHALIDRARKRMTEEGAMGGPPLHLDALDGDTLLQAADAPSPSVIKLLAALEYMEQVKPELAAIIEFRYYEDLTAKEIAALLGVSESTVKRRYEAAYNFLRQAMKDDTLAAT